MKIFRLIFIVGVALVGVFIGLQSPVQHFVLAKLMPQAMSTVPVLEGNIDDFFTDSEVLEQAVDRWYQKITLDQQIAQLIMPAWDDQTDPTSWVKQGTVGNVMLLSQTITPAMVQGLKDINRGNPLLFVASDAEPSLLKYRFGEGVFLGETNELKNADIKSVTSDIAMLLHQFGVNLNFAPVYDLGINKSVIGSRAFGTEPGQVIAKANLMTTLFKRHHILPTAKHFPGHGTVLEDTHLSEATITGRLQELPQFAAAIDNQVPVIMVGHLRVNTADYDSRGLPATLSPLIMQDLLRETLGFEGLIITDAMNMEAVSDFVDKDLKALQAGADIVLMPSDPVALHQQIKMLLNNDPVFAADIEAKVKRVLRLKLVWGMNQSKTQAGLK